MKTVRSLMMVSIVVLLLGGFTTELQAQGRGNGRGNNKEGHPGKGYHKDHHPGKGNKNKGGYDRDYHDHHRDYAHYDHRHYQPKRYVTYHHHRHSSPWAPVYGHRYNTRYIYYRDYNVYYDCHRDVFLTWSGRNWVVSARVPDVIYRVNFSRAAVLGVDYWDDDFHFYLQRSRPSFISISASW